MTAKENAFKIFKAAVAAVQPSQLVPQHLYIANQLLHIFTQHFSIADLPGIYVVGSGKASAAMAVTVENVLGNLITAGIIVTKYGHSLPLQKIICREAAHPVPDEQGIAATSDTLKLLQQSRPNDIIICLISGGASALWIDLLGDATIADIRETFRLLLESGAGIDEVNTIRRHLSAIKGGQLLSYAPQARWFTFIISDVPSDELQAIASGPTVPDNSSFSGAKYILEKYNLTALLPAKILQHINDGIDGLIKETTKPGDRIFDQVQNTIIGSNRIALQAAASKARELGYHVAGVDGNLTGDAASVGVALVRSAKHYEGKLPACWLLGGESTVTVTGKGKGGRNQQMALSALIELARESKKGAARRLTFLSAGTDGTDGPTDAAGAIADNEILSSATEKRLDMEKYLADNNAYHFFKEAGGLIITGATQTNVMDLVIVIIE